MSLGPESQSPPEPQESTPESRPNLPRLMRIADGYAPAAPEEPRGTGLESIALGNLALKAAYTVPQFTAEWAARRLHLPQPVVAEVLEQHRVDHLLEVLGQAGPFGFRYAITGRGRERAARLMEISGYVGPAPVTLASYTAMIEWQLAHAPEVTKEDVSSALSELVLDDEDGLLAGLAASSGRSLFIFGPPGNGKTSIGRMIHGALRGDLWIPHCIAIEENIIRIFDPQLHQPVEALIEEPWAIDQRWVRIRRPLIVGGGEMTLSSFDLTYSEALRFYEAPLHLKANGGTFLIDDYGRQRVEPHELLNRWIIPLEHQIDYLSLHTGQKIQVPFLQMLIIATNLDLEAVTDPAFLRRMGYRLYLGAPTPERYSQIFEQYAGRHDITVPTGVVSRLLERYQREKRELRSCEPRDLIERARDICRFSGRPLALDDEVMRIAWSGYFGNKIGAN
jgi:predicted ATPase with chaperone activity